MRTEACISGGTGYFIAATRDSCSVLGCCRSEEGKVSFRSSLPPRVTPHVWFRLQGTSSWASCPEACVAAVTNSDFLLQKNQVGNIRS